MRCDCILANTQFGIVLGYFQSDAVGIWLRHHLQLSQSVFDEMRLESGQHTILNCLRILSMRCDWILAKTQFENVLGFFQSDAMGIGLGHNLELSWDIFNQMRLEFG